MSLERNKKDFEDALDTAKETIDNLEEIINPAVLEPIRIMIDEYQNHYSEDIEELMDKVQELDSENDRLDNEITALEDELSELEDHNTYLENKLSTYED